MEKKWPPVDRICCECADFGFKGPNPDGPCTAYCFYHRRHFPDAWVEGKTNPANRTCPNWIQYGTVKTGGRNVG